MQQLILNYHLFKTPIGTCGLMWNEQGITRFELPNKSTAALIRRYKNFGACAAAPVPAWVKKVEARICLHLKGASDDFTDLILDLSFVPPFHRRVYQALRLVRPGDYVTYGELARRVGNPRAARAVAGAMAANPFALIVPCHRVVAVGGKIGGFSSFGGVATKLKLLSLEKVVIADDQILGV